MQKMLSDGGGEYFPSEVKNEWAEMELEECTVWLLLKSMLGLCQFLIFFEKVMGH